MNGEEGDPGDSAHHHAGTAEAAKRALLEAGGNRFIVAGAGFERQLGGKSERGGDRPFPVARGYGEAPLPLALAGKYPRAG